MIAGPAQPFDPAGERRVRVELGDARSYDVVIGSLRPGSGQAHALEALDELDARAVAVLYDRSVEPLARAAIARLGERVVTTRGVAGGEELKTLEMCGELYDWLTAARLDRDALLVAVGGGTLTDVAGFVAATFLRGIRWCAVPTTLLAAVDAAVGGKTAINIAAGKNLVGAFHHPVLVAIDAAAFATLDSRDLAAGMGEALKTGLVADAELFAYLERVQPRALAAEPEALAYVVARCVAAKAVVVAGDEFERDPSSGRAILNFGHTVGHALEQTLGYGALRHGEAVTLGMRPAVALSRMRGLPAPLADRVEALVRAIPTPPIAPDNAAILAAMGTDKKRKAGRLRFILLRDIAAPYIVDDVTEAELDTALAALT